MSTAAADLRQIATTWRDLNDALGMPAQIGGFGRGLRAYLAATDALDADEVEALGHQRAARRFLEQDAHLLGVRPIPIRLGVYETMRVIEAALIEVADQTAAAVQRPSMSPAPRNWPASDRQRRDQLARADAIDPRRWRYTGTRTAQYAALWLLGRVTGTGGPFTPLSDAQSRHIGHVAQEARHRIEQALDTGAETVTLTPPCPGCGGTITVYGGAGASPLANCASCGGVWSELGAAA
ncbi:hypothetical protein [Streptomyces sp. LN549]|uniref:hypothetical protein n=1 Tax=Streptomyces sp. LN549 TaxID=3112979 RepID=UPI00371DFED7